MLKQIAEALGIGVDKLIKPTAKHPKKHGALHSSRQSYIRRVYGRRGMRS